MSAPVSDPASSVVVHPWNPAGTGSVDEKSLATWVENGLARIGRLLTACSRWRVRGRSKIRCAPTTMRLRSFRRLGSLTGLMHSVYPDKPMRDTAQALTQNISAGGRGAGTEPGCVSGAERNQRSPAPMKRLGTMWSGRCCSTAWQASTRTMRPAPNCASCRTKRPC